MSSFSKFMRLAGPYGGYALAKYLCRDEPRVLMYHRFADPPAPGCTSPQYFEEQVRYALKYYNPMTLADLFRYADKHKVVPKNAVVFTIDDGYEDFYRIAFPILKKYGVPATVFVATGFINGDIWLWPDQVSWLLNNTDMVSRVVEVAGYTVSPGYMTPQRRAVEWRGLIEALLAVSDDAKHAEIKLLGDALELELPRQPPSEFAPMTWDQLKELEQFGIEIGGHTVTHPSLGRVSPEQAEDEVYGCFGELQKKLGKKSRTFCYPNGQTTDYTPDVQKKVQEAGFLAAVTAFPDSRGFKERFAIRRHVSGDDMFQFYKGISGMELLGHRLRRTTR